MRIPAPSEWAEQCMHCRCSDVMGSVDSTGCYGMHLRLSNDLDLLRDLDLSVLSVPAVTIQPCPNRTIQNNDDQSINQSIYIYRKNVNSMTIGYWCVRVHLSVRVRVCICIYMNLYVLYMLLMCTSICMIMYDHVQQYETCIHVHVHCCVGT